MIEIEINTNDSNPVYIQIIRQVYSAILNKDISAGFTLPPIRQLARDLSINHNTVAKAYRILEDNNIIHTAGRRGTFIKDEAIDSIAKNLHQIAENKLSDVIKELKIIGVENKLLRKIFNDLIKE